MLVAIDGPSGVGKSTVAAGVAVELALPHLDTGSTYRAAAIAAIDAGVPLRDEASVAQSVAAARIAVSDGVVTINERDVTMRLRSDHVTRASSVVAAYPAVRRLIVEVQRAWVVEHGGAAVVEGRDIGTVVFPDAPVKVFLTARPEIRAERRAGDTETAGKPVEEIADDLAHRDHRDATREASPLRPADDADVIDTSDLSAEQVVSAVIDVVEAAVREERYELGSDG